MPGALVLGGDLGGTSTRVLLAQPDGRVLASATTGGGNPTTDPARAAASLASALGTALRGLDASAVASAVLGVAGGSALEHADVRAVFAREWETAGLHCPPVFVTDVEVAFASGTAEPGGTVLVAGTGAAAAEVRGRRVVRTAGGHGWLLGDDGSGFWLGREAVRTTLRALDAGDRLGVLGESVLAALDVLPAEDRTGPASARTSVVRAVTSKPPVWLSTLAPLVSAAFDASDPVAADIVDRGAAALADIIGTLRSPEETTPLVLAGSLTRHGSPIGDVLRSRLADRFAGPAHVAGNGVGGAAWLAVERLDPALATPDVHARLTATPS